MGKINENALKKYRSNVRVDPACLSHYMCYYCGMVHSDRLEYQQHMLKVHEVLSQSYQLWSDHTMDSLGLRWSETKQPDEHENSGSFAASPKSTSKAKDSEDDDDEDYVYEEDEKSSRKRRRDDEGGKSKGKKTAEKMRKDELRRKIDAENKRRKRAEDRRREEKARREEEMRIAEAAAMKTLEMRKEVEAVREVKLMEGVEEEKRPEITSSEKKKRRRTDGSRRKEGQPEKDMPEVDFLVKKILEEGKKKEASREEAEDVDIDADPVLECKNRRILEADAFTTKYCKVCKKGTHYNFASLFQHYIQHHHAVIDSFNYYGYNGMKLVAKRTLTAKEVCLRCVVKFPSSEEYYYHMIANHMFESVRCQPDFETVTHADIEAKLGFRDRILSCGYRLALVLPEKSLTTAPGSSASQAPNSQEPKPETQVPGIANEEPKEAPKHDEPSTSTAIPIEVDS